MRKEEIGFDLRDLTFYGMDESQFEILDDINLKQRIGEATHFYNNNRDNNGILPKHLRRFKGNRLIMNNGIPSILHIKKGEVVLTPFKEYQEKLVRNANIPRGFLKDIKKVEGQMDLFTPGQQPVHPAGTSKGFASWWSHYQKELKGEQAFYKKLGNLYVALGLEKKRHRQSPEKDLSHFWPKKEGGAPFTFLEAWMVNQRRGATPLLSRELLSKAGVPTTWPEILEAWKQEDLYFKTAGTKGKLTALGPLASISGYDIEALTSGVPLKTITTRNNWVDKTLDDVAFGKVPYTEEIENKYSKTIKEIRGPNYPGTNTYLADDILVSLKARKKWILDNGVKNHPLLPKIQAGIDYFSGSQFQGRKPVRTSMLDHPYQELVGKLGEDPSYRIGSTPADVSRGMIQEGFQDVDVWEATPTEPKPRNPLKRTLQIGGGGLLLNAGRTLAAEAPYSVLNPETAGHVGEGLAKFQDTGEVDMDNVKGAAAGFGKDLAFGAVTGGGLKAAFKAAATKGATHFGAKSLVGKAVPYVGWGMLAYGLYDTADAFVEGLTKKGISERLGEQYNNIIEDAFSPENSFFKQRKVEPEHDIQGTL